MQASKKIHFFQEKILMWFTVNARIFPWRRRSANNYLKIISEVLLQRTKAETVARYLPSFLKMYPSWTKLSSASEGDLILALKPLGLHNQRGKRLFKLAQELKLRRGIFPKDRAVVEDISMMGQYITNAYELFILKRPAPLLDVNMARVLERFFGPRLLADIRYDSYLQALAKAIVEHPESVKINWAILDFAAIVCKVKPKCELCAIASSCTYFNSAN